MLVIPKETSIMWTLSTAHITEETAIMLEKNGFNEISSFSKDNMGYFVYIPDRFEENTNISSELKTIINIAIASNIHVICFDRDGEIQKELPVFDW